MRILFALFLLPGFALPVFGAADVTIQNALKLLPKEEVKNLVRIEAREGDPAPERWYIQVYDPAAENGLHEFVVSGTSVVASRSLSQFLTGAKPEDVVGSKLVKVDSDDLLKLLQQYVEANHLSVAKVNFTMLRDASNPAPVWKLACFDDHGKNIGELVINARNANVVSHEGFELVPGQQPEAKPSATATPREKTAEKEKVEKEKSEPPVRAAVPVRQALPVKPAPTATPRERRPLFQRMFGGGRNKNDQPQPSPTR